VLVARGHLTPERLDEALAEQVEDGSPRRRLGRILIDEGLLDEHSLAVALGDLLGLPVVDLSRETVEPDVARLLPRAVAERTQIVVLALVGRAVRVAAADPTNVVALDDVRLHTGAHHVDVVVATESQVRDHLRRLWTLTDESLDITAMSDESDEPPLDERALRSAVDDAPTVRLVSAMLAEAVREGASDLHVEPQRDGLRIRHRVDGVLRDVMLLPKGTSAAVVSRLKILSGLDIAERRIPQDGRARIAVDGTAVDARVSTLPGLHGEKVVLRLFAADSAVQPLATLGLATAQLDIVERLLAAPQGLVLITGPTGSGKTRTLYAALARVLTAEVNVVTLEDPIELQLPGITQVAVHPRSGMTFARGLRAVLRQDPDVVMVGEVRDSETAELALQAALTGHLVLTTLHTNDAPGALTRLVDMGVEPYLVASSLSLVVAQRLVRKPCPACSGPYEPPDAVLAGLGLGQEALAGATPRRGDGCPACAGSGYRGRRGVFEVLEVTPVVRHAIGGGEEALAAAAAATGLQRLREHALAVAARGETTYEEVLRATRG
jgi:type IV pilus assembly protein PilB